jgi:hypothetical protein
VRTEFQKSEQSIPIFESISVDVRRFSNNSVTDYFVRSIQSDQIAKKRDD